MATPNINVHALSDEQIKKLALKYRTELNFVRAAIAADRALRVPAAPDAEFVLEQISVYINALEANGDEPSAEHEAAVETEWVVLERAVRALAASHPAPKEAP